MKPRSGDTMSLPHEFSRHAHEKTSQIEVFDTGNTKFFPAWERPQSS